MGRPDVSGGVVGNGDGGDVSQSVACGNTRNRSGAEGGARWEAIECEVLLDNYSMVFEGLEEHLQDQVGICLCVYVSSGHRPCLSVVSLYLSCVVVVVVVLWWCFSFVFVMTL